MVKQFLRERRAARLSGTDVLTQDVLEAGAGHGIIASIGEQFWKPGVAEQQTCTLPDVPPVRAAIPWAPASIQMTDELFNRAIVLRIPAKPITIPG